MPSGWICHGLRTPPEHDDRSAGPTTQGAPYLISGEWRWLEGRWSWSATHQASPKKRTCASCRPRSPRPAPAADQGALSLELPRQTSERRRKELAGVPAPPASSRGSTAASCLNSARQQSRSGHPASADGAGRRCPWRELQQVGRSTPRPIAPAARRTKAVAEHFGISYAAATKRVASSPAGILGPAERARPASVSP